MKTERYSKKIFVIAVAFVMVISQIVTLAPANANTVMPVAQYVSSSGSVQNVAPNKATYNGKVNINVPITKVLAPFEADMKNAADNGWYPHGREGKNKIAYIEYNVTFPETVDIGTITKTNTSSIINGNRIVTSVNGRTVNFKMYLNDVNWASIYNYYNSDKANPDAHTVKLEIPYSITANSKAEAEKFESERITAQGNFAFYPSGTGAMFGFGLQVFNTDVASVGFTSSISDSPSFPTDVGTNGDLEGDLLLGSETEHDKVYETTKDAIMDFTGALNVAPIKQELRRLESVYNSSGVKVENINTEFEATITLPDGMEFKDANPEVALSGENGKFEITSHSILNNKVTVKLSLKNASSIKTYSQLANAVDSVDDTLKVTVKGARFSGSATPDTNYTVTGYVGGTFTAKATSANNRVINFSYKWNGKQLASGADAIAPNDLNKITFTVKYKIPDETELTATEDLMGDILIGDETEHDKVYETTKDASHEFTGLLNVKPIKDKMKQIEAAYNNPLNHRVSLDNVDTTFTASLELPAEMAFTETTPTAKLEGANGVFKITNVQKIGNKVTVTLKLVKNYSDYDEFAADIKSVDDNLKVKVSGAVFTAAAKPNTNYTVKGEISGDFKGTATMNATGKVVKFKFAWKGKQLSEGADAIAPNDLNNITFTLKYKSSSPTVVPPTPNKPVVPNKPNTGDRSNLPIYLAVAGLAGIALIGGAVFKRKKQK